ncbi:serine-protein kinase ATM-like isoform 2-T2 [Salvelinus alpinus]
MTLYDGAATEGGRGDLRRCIGELDPAPNPPSISSNVIKATLDYLSKCHSASHKSLVAILSRTLISIQRILLAVCQKAAETINAYERHRPADVPHACLSTAQGGQGRPGGSLGLRPPRHYRHTYPPHQQQTCT